MLPDYLYQNNLLLNKFETLIKLSYNEYRKTVIFRDKYSRYNINVRLVYYNYREWNR